jgi:hypothetical protein
MKKTKKVKKIKEQEKREKVAISVFSFLVLFLFATFIILNSSEIMQITGYAQSGSGQVNVTITQNLSIYVQVMNMTFGTGHVETGQSSATINSSTPVPPLTSTMLAAANWINETTFEPQSFELVNDGNVNASVTITGDHDADDFIGGTSPAYEYNASNEEALSCVTGATIQDWTDVTTGSTTVCTNLGSADGADELYVDIRLTIPSNTQGELETFVTFSASAVT